MRSNEHEDICDDKFNTVIFCKDYTWYFPHNATTINNPDVKIPPSATAADISRTTHPAKATLCHTLLLAMLLLHAACTS